MNTYCIVCIVSVTVYSYHKHALRFSIIMSIEINGYSRTTGRKQLNDLMSYRTSLQNRLNYLYPSSDHDGHPHFKRFYTPLPFTKLRLFRNGNCRNLTSNWYSLRENINNTIFISPSSPFQASLSASVKEARFPIPINDLIIFHAIPHSHSFCYTSIMQLFLIFPLNCQFYYYKRTRLTVTLQ